MDVTTAARSYMDHLAQVNKAQLTFETYGYAIGRFLKFLEVSDGLKDHDDVDRITIDHVRNFGLRLYRDRLSASTRRKYLVVLRNWFKHLSKLGLSILNVELIELPKLPPRVPNPDERLPLMLSIVKDDREGWRHIIALRDRAILETLFSTQLRVSELVSLNRNSIDWSKALAVVIGKGGKPRTVFFSEGASSAVSAYLDERKDKFIPLFIHHDRAHKADAKDKDGQKMRLTRQAIEAMVRKYSRLAGVEATPHSFRHYGATELIRAGADIRTVQEILGHASVSTTQIYTHVNPKRLQQEWKKYHPSSNQ
ncbi:MAG: hypothetical protein EXR50_08805 [Dehalococcoidia bacterium]|nr:hypothetical protein [Dehalococcoidia bacterium]